MAPPIPLIPVTITTSRRDLATREVIEQHPLEVLGEPTASEHLVIAPTIDVDGHLGNGWSLTHVPTGLAVTFGHPSKLRETAQRLAGLDWSFTDPQDVKAIAADAKKVLRDLAWTDPSAADLPAHDAWGKDGKGKGLPRAAVASAKDILADYQRCQERMHGEKRIPHDVPDPDSERGRKSNPEWMHEIIRSVHDFGLAYLLLVLHRLDPAAADSAAAWLADQWESGDTLGEWAWEWGQALAQDKPLELQGIPELGPLLTT